MLCIFMHFLLFSHLVYKFEYYHEVMSLWLFFRKQINTNQNFCINPKTLTKFYSEYNQTRKKNCYCYYKTFSIEVRIHHYWKWFNTLTFVYSYFKVSNNYILTLSFVYFLYYRNNIFIPLVEVNKKFIVNCGELYFRFINWLN